MNFRDVELLSAYLDGQTSPSDSTRLESRLATDPELAATLQALRESRGLLRQLPKRRAPRNFTLTPKMVGQKPPLPRSYPIFRFATALAAILFVFTYATNQVSMMAASAPQYGIGGGGGGGDGNDVAEAPMMEAMPAATEPPATEAPAETGLAMIEPTATPELAADSNRAADEPPVAKDTGETVPAPEPASVPFRISTILMIAFAVIALLGAASMFLIQRLAAKKWRSK
jgi:hypothetical protein